MDDIDKIAKEVLREYLIRCFEEVSKQYPPIKKMQPDEGADHLLKLQDEGKIDIKLYTTENNIIACRISSIN